MKKFTLVIGILITSAQASEAQSLLKSVLLDPTTYAPASSGYIAEQLDWNSSQPLFRVGGTEQNARFTRERRPFGTPLDYATGNKLILRDALQNVGWSALHNLSSHVLIKNKVLGRIERAAFAVAFGYYTTAAHLRQTAANKHALCLTDGGTAWAVCR